MIYFLPISFLILIAVISSISDDPIKMYCDISICGEGLSGAIMDFSVEVSFIDGFLTCNEKDNIKYNYSTDFFPAQYYIDISNKYDNNVKIFLRD